MKEQNRNRMAILLCVIMLLLCLGVLAYYLLPVNPGIPEAALEGDTLGMVLIDIPDEEAAAFYHVDRLGVYVLAVDEESVAYRSGVRSGDCIVSVNGSPVSSTTEFTALQEMLPAGEALEITFMCGSDSELLVTAFTQDAATE